MKRKKTALGAVTKWTLIIGGTIALFILGKEAALRERGYRAIGGEALILFIPIIYYVAARTVKDWIETICDLQREE